MVRADPGAEDRGADAHMRGAVLYGDLEIAAHAHAELGQAMGARQLAQPREEWRGRLVVGRDAHQTGDLEAERATFGEQRIDLRWRHAGLLRLLADIDLDEELGRAASAREFLGEFAYPLDVPPGTSPIGSEAFVRKYCGSVKEGPVMLAAVETVTKADPVWASRRHNLDVAAQANRL